PNTGRYSCVDLARLSRGLRREVPPCLTPTIRANSFFIMQIQMRNFLISGFVLVSSAVLSLSAVAQPAPAPGRGRGPQSPQVVSPELAADGRVIFRVLAPKAEKVRLSGGDIPGNGQGTEMTRGTNGIWEAMLGPIRPG